MAGLIGIEQHVPITPLDTGPAPQAVQAGLLSVTSPDSIGQAAAEMVARADCRLAQAHLPRGAA